MRRWVFRVSTDISRPEWDRTPAKSGASTRVSVIVPARNEEHDILRRLLALDYNNYEVVAVDDRSSDRTGEIIGRLARSKEALGILKVISIDELPSG